MSGSITQPFPNSSYLAFQLNGVLANTGGNAPSYQNPDPAFVGRNLLNTVYFWAQTWGGASVQIFVAPQRQGGISAPVWFPVGDPITENSMFSFQHRWNQMKAEISGATGATADLFCKLFDGGIGA